MEWRLRILTFFILALFAVVGCGGGTNDAGNNRVEDGGTGGSGGAGGTGGDQCNCPVGQDCDDAGECISSCGAVTACVQGNNFTCCPSGTVCDSGSCVVDCGAEPDCNGVCCGDGEMCFEDACVADCENTDNLCGDSSQYCCGDGEACLQEQCIPTGDACDPTDALDLSCTDEEICEFSTESCISRDLIEVCEYHPPTGVFDPKLACRWTPPVTGDTEIDAMTDVVMTPAVADLTDDGIPELVFISFNYGSEGCCTGRSVVRVVSGRCNDDGDEVTPATMTTLATLVGSGVHQDDPDGLGYVHNSSGVALGNLHPDSNAAEKAPEIVATYKWGGTVAWRRTANDGTAWEIFWQNDALPTIEHTGGGEHFGPAGAQPSIADLNADGQPEVIIGNVVLNGQDGSTLWDGLDLEVDPEDNVGIGNNAFVGPVSVVADLDLDGLQEVIAGNTVYNHDGTERWTFKYTTSNGVCSGFEGSLECDGFNAVGNFDDDDEGEVVIVRQGEIFVLDHDYDPDDPLAEPLYQVPIPVGRLPLTFYVGFYEPVDIDPGPVFSESGEPYLDWVAPTAQVILGGKRCALAQQTGYVFDGFGNQIFYEDQPVYTLAGGTPTKNEGGPPTIADFDGDGQPEIGVASSTAYAVIDFQCMGDPLPEECESEFVRWTQPNDDCSSRSTGSSVFDFEGDGKAEVVYADEVSFRIFSGVDGTVLFEDLTHDSNTRVEMPIIVDLDADGKSEVVVPEPDRLLRSGFGGIDVWKDAENNWVRTRKVWNQHAYSVTNVTEDGQIPREPVVNWLNSRLNNFRQNIQPGGLFDAPDFVVRSIARDSCISSTTDLTIVVGNDGALSVPDGIKVFVQITGSVTEEYVLETTEWLLPGQSEALELEVNAPGASVFTVTVTVDDDGEGNDQYNECFEDNNTLAAPITACGVQ